MAAHLLLLICLLICASQWAHCDRGPTGARLPNRPPVIEITAGPMQDSLHVHRVTFYWTALDVDGEVARFEYAVDDTTISEFLTSTTNHQVTLSFTADAFLDTTTIIRDGRPLELQRFHRNHVFFVRAVDDEGSCSAFAIAAFNAFTIAPLTQILNPNPRFIPTVGMTFEIVWESEDLDGTRSPELFSIRLVRVPADSVELVDPGRLDRPGGGPPWSDDQSSNIARLEGISPGHYLFGIRATDDAGAREQLLRIGGNVTRLQVQATGGVPRVTLSGPGHSVSLPVPFGADDPLFDLISGRPATFSWSADASHYAARITGHAYGIDLESVDPADPGWVPVPSGQVTIRLDNPPDVEDTQHLFHLRLRDSIDQVHVFEAYIHVGPPDFGRDILYIDDVGWDRISALGHPSDGERDALIQDLLLAEARRRGLAVDQVELQSPEGYPLEAGLDLELLRRYRLLVWSVGRHHPGSTRAADPASGRPLAAYLARGGNLYLFGQAPLTRSMTRPTTHDLFGFDPGEFGYDFLHVETVFEGSQIAEGGFLLGPASPAQRRIHGMDGAIPTPAASAEGWPSLLVAKAPFTDPIAGIPSCEGMVVGYGQGVRPGRLDTLYHYVTNGSLIFPPLPSLLHGTPCAFRYAGPDQGKVMVLCFPVYFWSDGAVDSLGRRALSWFFDNEGRSP